MAQKTHHFGGDWTEQKLKSLGKYLKAYATIMAKQPFKFAYIDAFAGTGYISLKAEDADEQLLLPEFTEDEPQEFLKGSARNALDVRPQFDKYIFVEKSANRATELEKLRTEYSSLSDRIEIVIADANSHLQDLADRRNWKKHRAVIFLDPYGMQVRWETIRSMARTKAIDLWLLFPLGVAVNRLLRRDGNIDEKQAKKLDEIFGTRDWRKEFYREEVETDLYGTRRRVKKIANSDAIGRYFLNRLRGEFSAVASNPQELRNSKNVPLYLLCFAAGNPKGAPTAIKIAENILAGERHGEI